MNPVDLLSLPVDLYQRYTAAAQIAEAVKANLSEAHLTVLDVGGFAQTYHAEAYSPLAEFLRHDRVFAVDLACGSLNNYALASGLALPFPAGALDLVVSCDTLEHIPPPDRDGFIDELTRVARYATVLIAPFDSESLRRAERALHDHAERHGTASIHLKEHLALGLPDMEATRTHLAKLGLPTVSIPDGYLPNWLALMQLQHTSDQSVAFLESLAQYYNCYFSPFDRREPSYRQVIIAASPGHADILPVISSALRPDYAVETLSGPAPAAELAELLMLNREKLALENARLRSLLKGYERGRFIRFTRWLHERTAQLRGSRP